MPVESAILSARKVFKATGNSTTMNRQAQQEIAVFVYDRVIADPLLQVEPSIQRQVRQMLFDAFDVTLQLPTAEELQKATQDQQVAAATEALRKMPEEEKAQLFAGLLRSQMGQMGLMPTETGNGALKR